jgi:DNA-binding CsgD family transcriptional regulator
MSTSRDAPGGDTTTLVRHRELERLREAIRAAESGEGTAVVVAGPPRSGRTELLAAAQRSVTTARVLRASGRPEERDLPYAVLDQLLGGLGSALPSATGGVEVGALLDALGRTGGVPAQVDPARRRMLIAQAVLDILAGAAAAGGLVCIVDDAQWIDAESRAVLTFVMRRANRLGAAVILATEPGDPAEGSDIARLDLGRIDPETAERVLTGMVPSCSDPVRHAVVDAADGLLGSIVELGDLVTAMQHESEAAVLAAVYDAAYGDRLAAVGRRARQLLLLADFAQGDEAVLGRAVAYLDADPEDFQALEDVGLIGPTRRVVIPSAAVRTLVYTAIPLDARTEVHTALAAVLDSDEEPLRRLWHEAQTLLTPSESVAHELEIAAVAARGRGDHPLAAGMFERAAALSTDEDGRLRRSIDAIWEYRASGAVDRVAELLRLSERLPALGPARHELALLRGTIASEDGACDQAHVLLIGGARDAVRDGEVDGALALLTRATENALHSGELDWIHEVDAVLRNLPEADDARSCFARGFIRATVLAHSDDVDGARAAMLRTLDQATSLTGDSELVRAGLIALLIGDDRARRFLTEAIEQMRSRGRLVELPTALNLLARVEVTLGLFDAATLHATECLAIATLFNSANYRAYALANLALCEAATGGDDCVRHAEESIRIAASRRLHVHRTRAYSALGQRELASSRNKQALAYFGLFADPGSPFHHPVGSIHAAPDYVEALARSGEPELAREAFERYLASPQREMLPSQAALVHRMAALVAVDEVEQTREFELALLEHARLPNPFELARTQLLYGEHLRRLRQPGDSRQPLRSALELFQAIGCAPWASRALAELRAAGEHVRGVDTARAVLTTQEQQIAGLVASGASNREVAEQLFLSHRTVEYHLRKVYSKLQITSRAALGEYAGTPPEG